jgi:hypothetical protein
MIDRSQKILKQSSKVSLVESAILGGLMIWGPSGWGKSRLLGRRISHQLALHNVGTVVLDVVGGTIDNALDKILYLDREEQLAVGEQLRYCNMAGERVGEDIYDTMVTSWPMLQFKNSLKESLYAVSQRPLDLIAKTDRNLATASIQGLNRLAPLLTSIGIVLSALEEPLSKAFDLLEGGMAWQQRLTNLAFASTEAQPACLYLLWYLNLPEKMREERSDVLRNKLSVLRFDPISRAMFSASTPSIDWEEVCYKGLQVYIDLRNDIYSEQAKGLKLFWVWNSLMDYIKSRGAAGRDYPPLAVVIDELSYFVRGNSLNTLEIIEDFREFVQVRKRNANIWLVGATQEILELPELMQRACLGIHSQMFGRIADLETALFLAKRFFDHEVDPFIVKHWRTVWGSDSAQGKSIYYPISYEPEFMSLDEQWYLQSKKFRTLRKGEWVALFSKKEGEPATTPQKISTRNLDPNMYVDSDMVTELRRRLMLRDGMLVSDVLDALDGGASEADTLPETNGLLTEEPPDDELPDSDDDDMGRFRTDSEQ